MYDVIPEVPVMLMQLSTVQVAIAKKEQSGGWVFAGDGGRVVWFDAQYFTASDVMTHPITNGQSGKLL